MLKVRAGDRLLLMSDGVIEHANTVDEQFGSERLQQVLNHLQPGASAVQHVLGALDAFSGAGAQKDDLTIFEVVVDPAVRFNFDVRGLGTEAALAPSAWSMRYEVRDAALMTFDPVAVLGPLLQGVPTLRPALGDIGLVLTELFTNALDHGVLKLDSSLKQSPRGFAEYFAARAQRLPVARGRIAIGLDCVSRGLVTQLTLAVSDSGAGFSGPDPSASSAEQADAAAPVLYGRGLQLMHQLCASVCHRDGGRTTEVVFTFEQEAADDAA